MVVAFPVLLSGRNGRAGVDHRDVHFVIEDLGLARFGLGNQAVVEHVEYILADLLELGLNLLAVLADDGDVLLRAFGLLLLLNGRDYAPGSTPGAYHVLISNRE